MYEEKNFEDIRDEMLELLPEDIDIREGSVSYDIVTSMAYKIAELNASIGECYTLTNLFTSTGEFLDNFALEHGLQRIIATSAIYKLVYSGTTPPESSLFWNEETDSYFTVQSIENSLYLVSEEKGTFLNVIQNGSLAVCVDNIDGLESSTFGELYQEAIDEESDEKLRKRIQNKMSGPSENGNKTQYKTWCESVSGVGRAIIKPLAYGPNTVEAILISTEGTAVKNSVVENVQKAIDPFDPPYVRKGVKLGSGYGEGLAPIGAHFLAKSAQEYNIDISLIVTKSDGYTIEQVKTDITNIVKNYLKSIALEAEDNNHISVSMIGAKIIMLESVTDYQSLKVNGHSDRFEIPEDTVPKLTEVVLS